MVLFTFVCLLKTKKKQNLALARPGGPGASQPLEPRPSQRRRPKPLSLGRPTPRSPPAAADAWTPPPDRPARCFFLLPQATQGITAAGIPNFSGSRSSDVPPAPILFPLYILLPSTRSHPFPSPKPLASPDFSPEPSAAAAPLLPYLTTPTT